MSEIGQLKHGRRGAFVVILVAGFMSLLDVSIVNVALPSIQQGLGAGESEIQWIVAGYALTFGLLLVGSGRGGDLFGRRRLFIIGVLGFVASSLSCGVATNGTWLIISRLIQGLFAGVLNPQVLGLIQDLFQGKERARAFGAYGMMIGVSTAVGPLLGGLLINLFGVSHGWRLVFLINVPIGIVLIPLAYKWLPQEVKAGHASFRTFDPMGTLILGASVLCIMWPFLEISEGSTAKSYGVFWLALVGVALLLLFWWWEKFWTRRGGDVVLDGRLFKSKSYVFGVITGFSYFAGFTSIFVVITLYLQQGQGFSPLESGLSQLSFAIASGLFAGMSGRLVNRFGRKVPVVGSAIMVISVSVIALIAAFVDESSAPWWIIAVLALAGMGSGLVISPNQALTLEAAPTEVAGVAGAVLQTMQRIGTAVGLAFVTTVFFLEADGGSYQSATSRAMWVIAAILFVSLCVNTLDLYSRRRDIKIP